MRRSGSAAPHSSWSPTVNAVRYCRPHGHLAQPADRHGQRAGDGRRRQLAHATPRAGSAPPSPSRCAAASMPSISSSGTSVVSLMVSAWLWQRIAPTRTQMPSIGIGRSLAAEDLVALGLRLPLLAALAVVEVLVDPGDQAAGQRHAEVLLRAARRCAASRPRCGRCRGSPTPDRRAGLRPTPCSRAHLLRAVRACSARRRRRPPGRSSRSSTRPVPP